MNRTASCLLTAAALVVGLPSLAQATPNFFAVSQNSEDSATLYWLDHDSNALSFSIYRKEGSAGYWRRVGAQATTSPGQVHVHTDSPLAQGQEYCYQIGTRVRGSSRVVMSAPRCLTPQGAPAKPSNAQLVRTEWNRVQVRWTDSSNNEDEFSVERKRWGIDSNWQSIHRAPASAGTGAVYEHDDRANLASEYSHCYRIAARNDRGTTYSNATCNTVPAWSLTPNSDNHIVLERVTHPGTGAIQLRWIDNSTTASTYYVRRGTYSTSYSSMTHVATIRDHDDPAEVGQFLSYVDKGLDPSDVYCYQVTATGGGTRRSSILCGSPFQRSGGAPPRAPRIDLDVLDNTSIQVDWDTPRGATGSFVERWDADERVRTRQAEGHSTAVGSYTLDVQELHAGNRYCFRAVAYNSFGETSSQQQCARTTASAPNPPSNFRVTTSGSSSMRLAWNASLNAASYDLEWSGTRPSYVSNSGDANTANTSYTLNGSSAYTYCVRIRARNSVGTSGWSREVCETLLGGGGSGGGQPESEWVCGTGCPAGFHAEEYGSIGGCSGSSTFCVENTGSSFYSCSIGCPGGYHDISYSDSQDCGTLTGSLHNQTHCERTDEVQFDQCGTGCPAGFSTDDRYYSVACSPTQVAGTTLDNAATCVPE